MIQSKPWYLSRTIWASIISILAAGAGFAGISTEAIDRGLLTDSILQVITAVSGVVAILGRVSATASIR